MQTLMPFCPLASAESSWAESTRSLWASWAIAEVGRTVRAWDKMSRTPLPLGEERNPTRRVAVAI